MLINNRRVKFNHWLEYIPAYIGYMMIRLMPEFIFRLFSRVLADFAFSVIKIRRKVSLQNLAVAFPEKSDEEGTEGHYTKGIICASKKSDSGLLLSLALVERR